MMKTFVKIIGDSEHWDYKKGDTGYIDWYVRWGNDVPLAVVVVDKHFVLVYLHCLERIDG